MKKPIDIRGNHISPIVISTAMGHSGDRIFDLPLWITNLSPSYRRLRRVIKESQVTNLTKSSTFQKHVGNFRPWNPLTWKYIQPIGEDGLINAYKLTNDGVKVNAPKIDSAGRNDFEVIPNFCPQFDNGLEQAIAEAIEAMEIYTQAMDSFFWAVEINLSCPNKEKIRENMANALALFKAIRQAYPELCLIAKISYVHPYEFAQELVRVGADIIHAINTIPHSLVYPNGPPSPLASVGGGGISGGPAFKQAFEYNKGLRPLISTPMIMGCGATSLDYVQRYYDIGANAVSICTVLRRKPKEAINIIEAFAA